MMRALAKVWARLAYLWELENEAVRSDINAGTAKVNATDKRKLVAQLVAEADAIDKNIEEQAKALEAGVWECENGHQKGGAFGPDADGAARKCIECNAPAQFLKISEMTGQEKYELEKQKGEAKKVAAEKRELAKQETENADNGDRTVAVLSGRAQDSRNFADKIRKL
jgi:hypothetical protein